MSCDTTQSAERLASRSKDCGSPAQSVSSRAGERYLLKFDEQTEHHRVYFYEPEYIDRLAFCWSQPLSMVRLDVHPGNYRVTIDTAELRGGRCKFPFQLRWNENRIPTQSIQIKDGKISFPVDVSMFQKNHEQRLTISCRPLKSDLDRRELGLPIATIAIEPADQVHTATIKSDQVGSWIRERSIDGFRHVLGKKSPSPLLPIWAMKLASIPTVPCAIEAADKDEQRKSGIPTENVVATAVEINSRHGTGLLVQYLFGNLESVTTICSKQTYQGERVKSLAHHNLPNGKLDRHEIYGKVLEWFRESPPKRAYGVAYFEEDLIIAMALKDLFGTKICLHFMDDQNFRGGHIPDSTMKEAIKKADLSFAISPEMRLAYQNKYGQKIYILPPIVPENLVLHEQLSFNEQASSLSDRGILIGNIWDEGWLNRLRETIRGSGYEIDWFSNDHNAVFGDHRLDLLAADLAADGIHLHDSLWGDDLIAELQRRPFALMPSGTLDNDDETANIARLSLPSRLPFMTATSQLPIIVLGSPETASARFVSRFKLGECVDYDSQKFQAAVKRIRTKETQSSIRERAARIGPVFSAHEMEAWLWQSLDQSSPADNRYEDLFDGIDNEFAYFTDERAPATVDWDKTTLWQALKRLQLLGLNPETIIDIGASTGVWSWTAAKVFPKAHYVMVDPLISHYPDANKQYYLRGIDSHQLVEAALSDQSGEAEFLVSDDLYGSSLLKVDEAIRAAKKIKVPVRTLDELADSSNWQGSTLLKIDVQFAEHLVLAGGKEFIQSNVDALILELTIQREHPDAKTYREMLDLVDDLGYQLVDETDGWRSPRNGILEQKDSIFVRRELLKQIESCKEGSSLC